MKPSMRKNRKDCFSGCGANECVDGVAGLKGLGEREGAKMGKGIHRQRLVLEIPTAKDQIITHYLSFVLLLLVGHK